MLTEQENEKNELIVVFKKDVTPDDAESMLKTAPGVKDAAKITAFIDATRMPIRA